MVFYLVILSFNNSQDEVLDINIVATGDFNTLYKLKYYVCEHCMIVSSCDELFIALRQNDFVVSNKLSENFVERIDNEYFQNMTHDNVLLKEIDELLNSLFG